MSEHEHAESKTTDQSASNPRRARDRAAGGAADGLSAASLDGVGGQFPTRGARRAHFPKDDRRSSARLTEREQSERWPLG